MAIHKFSRPFRPLCLGRPLRNTHAKRPNMNLVDFDGSSCASRVLDNSLNEGLSISMSRSSAQFNARVLAMHTSQ